MADNIAVIKSMYECFNARDIDGVIDALTDDVEWANAMEGGHVHGHEGVRDYWTRQWAIVNPHVEPVSFKSASDNSIVVEVDQTIFDLDGKPLHEHTNQLKNKMVQHIFYLEDDKVNRFDVREVEPLPLGGSK